MTSKRIIPCLDIVDGRVVKGVNFEGLKDVADPVSLAAYYNEQGADELVFYDITASAQGRSVFSDVLRDVASKISIPLTVGGGVSTLDDFERALSCGADKISINTGAVENPSLIKDAAKKYGSRCVVLALDVKRVGDAFHIIIKGGRVDTGMDALDWAARAVADGAGEVVVNSIDTDGVKGGFDLEMLAAVAGRVDVPIIASGGAGSMQDFADLFALPGIDAGLAASIFHYKEVEIPALKQFLTDKGIPVRTD